MALVSCVRLRIRGALRLDFDCRLMLQLRGASRRSTRPGAIHRRSSRNRAALGNRCAAEDLHILCGAREPERPDGFAPVHSAFSKKLTNHVAAVSLYVAHFNLCRVHESLRITPAIAMGITDHIWAIGELIDAATVEPIERQAA